MTMNEELAMNASNMDIGRSLHGDAKGHPRFAHVVFRTARFQEMTAFWKVVLDAHAAFESEQIAFLRFDDEHHRLAIVNMPWLEDNAALGPGFEHVSFTFASLGELLSQYRRLSELSIIPIWCINHGVTTSIYYADPDGNQVEFQFDNMENDAADAFMRGPYFAVNPIGVDFDPELLIERYLRGDPLEELVRQGSAPHPEGVELPQPPRMIPYDRRGALLTN